MASLSIAQPFANKSIRRRISIPGGAGKRKTATLTANDTRLLQFLKMALSTTLWTPLTGSAMAKGSGLPLGSVGISLKKVMGTGAVKKGARGTYKLAA